MKNVNGMVRVAKSPLMGDSGQIAWRFFFSKIHPVSPDLALEKELPGRGKVPKKHSRRI
jgi:hypothetical protein